MDFQLIKVIARRTVFGDKTDVLKLVMSDEKATHFVYRVWGSVTGSVTGLSKHKKVDQDTGEVQDQYWTRFVGEFYCVNLNKDAFESSIVYLPNDVSSGIKAEFEKEGTQTVEFAYDIFARYNKDSITSYEFIARAVTGGDDSRAKQMTAALPPLPFEKAPKALVHTSKGK